MEMALKLFLLIGLLSATVIPSLCEKSTDDMEDDEVIDLTHQYSNTGMTFWPGHFRYNLSRAHKGAAGPYNVYFESNNFETTEHAGTHMDAPNHFVVNGRPIEQIKLESVIGPGVVVDISEKAKENPDYQATVLDMKEWETNHGQIIDGALFLLNTGWHRHFHDEEKYLGMKKGGDMWTEMHFPGLHVDTAKWLLENRNIKLYGVDTVSNDYGQSKTFPVHKVLLRKNVPLLENVANLDNMPPTGTKVFAIPMNIKDGTGAPTRLFAIKNEATSTRHVCITIVFMSALATLFLKIPASYCC